MCLFTAMLLADEFFFQHSESDGLANEKSKNSSEVKSLTSESSAVFSSLFARFRRRAIRTAILTSMRKKTATPDDNSIIRLKETVACASFVRIASWIVESKS